ncbi:MAG: type II toxin-antitoxin system Phd/YefM family antitoxin [Fibrobacterota bacterium]
MPLSVTDDIRSITDLKRHTNDILGQIHKTGRPVVLTINGKAEAVLMDAREFDKLSAAVHMMQLLQPAEEDFKDGRHQEARAFFKEFRRAKKI